MILEGFEIENWSCIGRVAVADLPSSGVVVLHGPNGTGKSSIIAALRACLMDNKSTSKALDRGFSRISDAKPRVSVTFRAAGSSWKITKQFNSKESKLESRTPGGEWKAETTDPSESHERTRQLCGGCDSNLGLHQLLWLTQAEFHLPEPKKFDADVQSKLRSVLGVLQTPLDDRFVGRVKDEWSGWFNARGKPGEKPKRKKECSLEKNLADLQKESTALSVIEAQFQAYERMMEKSGDLELLARDLRRQLDARGRDQHQLQDEYERSLKRLEAHRLAAERVAVAEKIAVESRAKKQQRADAEQRVLQAKKSADAAGLHAEEKSRLLQGAEQKLRELRITTQAFRQEEREVQTRLNGIRDRRQLLNLRDQEKAAREHLQQAERTTGELEELKKQALTHPSPDAATLKKLEENRTKADRLRAELEAAAIALMLILHPGSPAPRIALDGSPELEAKPTADGAAIQRSVRRRVEIAIAGWGRLEFTRGSDARSLDKIETDLNELDRAFAEGLAPFGIAATDATAIDILRGLAADQRVREPELKRKKEDIARLAPHGLDALRQEVAKLEKLLLAGESTAHSAASNLPVDAETLDRLAARFAEEIGAIHTKIVDAERRIAELELEIDGPDDDAKKSPRGKKSDAGGLRKQEATVKDAWAAFNATADVLRQELDRLLTPVQIEQAIGDADRTLAEFRAALEAVKLSESEETIRERLDAALEGMRAVQDRLTAAKQEFDEIKGALSQSEGQHQKRAAAAARVEALTALTEREMLESDAYDRLYALFEECREKQLGTVMGPIHDRVVNWMRLLRIGDYKSIRFNDQFLPEKLLARDGAFEMEFGDESTGTIEQLALMVRLALGSTLSTPTEPVVALLDDPLTHSDVVRLDRMRAVLKHAAAGDPSSTPPAGPLQIVVFTCHPEWFAIDGAKLVDLAGPNVMSRLST